MGINDQVETVPGVTEEDLRQAAMARANRRYNRAVELAAHEFTINDWIEFVLAEEGRQLSETSAKRELDDLVADGVLGKTAKDDKRYDPRTQRSALAYWYLEDGTGPGDRQGRGPP